ncbi:hypothetical protein RRG08_013457 [Elysia crispata]|uniref:Uncharacterized protein n=1 Tax=Elysia crispata TaxID=231223 RepID=A0AAE1EBN4_9GAST|nr:hypothetical protein RRG08_013457 [Elysia crispata]
MTKCLYYDRVCVTVCTQTDVGQYGSRKTVVFSKYLRTCVKVQTEDEFYEVGVQRTTQSDFATGYAQFETPAVTRRRLGESKEKRGGAPSGLHSLRHTDNRGYPSGLQQRTRKHWIWKDGFAVQLIFLRPGVPRDSECSLATPALAVTCIMVLSSTDHRLRVLLAALTPRKSCGWLNQTSEHKSDACGGTGPIRVIISGYRSSACLVGRPNYLRLAKRPASPVQER